MKISIGTRIKDGPWGGGNLFAINLKKFLEKKGHKVIHNLDDEDIDIILMTEPRKTSESSAFTQIDVRNYLNYIKNDAIVVHRFNECDERKGTNYVNKYLINANQYSDQNVFVSNWLKNLFLEQGLKNLNNTVIYAGADSQVFNNTNYNLWNQESKMRIVTHHWGSNWNKGFGIYSKIDELLENSYWKNKIEFTYIGNLPKNFSFKNTKHIEPLSGLKLAEEIKKSYVYLTASINEPSGNHHIEAAQCGLPVMYIDSGGTPEYCKGYGHIFTEDNFEDELNNFISRYFELVENMKNYPFSSEKMCQEYESLFEKLLNDKDKLIKARKYIISEGISNKIFYFIKRKLNKKFHSK